ncbi:ABC transporter substrate-binding protein [Streptomyces sp. NPDC015661]|uniref:ABC transporter substrate-binding protein n=1 Tax=Streptomyces sp. NPDC015661 TaxID=3364961 RepID=UPI0036F8FAA3
MPKKWTFLVAAAVAATASACTTSTGSATGSPAGDAPGSGTIRAALTSDVTTFDPAKATGASDDILAQLRYQTLVARDSDGKVLPALAESWTQAPTVVTLTLRADATCSDGKSLTASQAAASLRRYADPATGSTASAIVFGPEGKPTFAADDAARTITVTVAQPWSDLLPALSSVQTGIVCSPGLADLKALAAGDVPGAGTGAYTLADVQRGAAYGLDLRPDFKSFPTYAQQPPGAPARTLRFSVVNNESTIANQLQTGQLDFAPLTGPDAARFTDQAKYTTLAVPLIRFFVTFNERPGHPGSDPAVRKAIAQALDPAAFDKVFGGKGRLMASYVDPSAPCANTDASVLTAPDPAAAEAALTGVRIKVTGPNAVAGGAGNDYVQAALKAAGADVTLSNLDNATWATNTLGNKGEWDVNVFAYISGSLTYGAAYFTGAEPPAGRNFGAVDNPAFLSGFAEALETVDPKAKCAAWTDAQRALLAAHDIVPLSTVNVSYVSRKGIAVAAPDGMMDAGSLRIDG